MLKGLGLNSSGMHAETYSIFVAGLRFLASGLFTRPLLPVPEPLSRCPSDLPQQHRRDVPALVKGHGGSPAVGMAKSLASATLPDLDESQRLESGNHLQRLEYR